MNEQILGPSHGYQSQHRRSRRGVFRRSTVSLVLGVLAFGLASSPAYADNVVQFTLNIQNLTPGSVVKLSQGAPSNCTRDEKYGDYTATASGTVGVYIQATIRTSGSCFFEASYNTWKVTLPNGGSGDILLDRSRAIAAGQDEHFRPYCTGTWTQARCYADPAGKNGVGNVTIG